MRRGDPFAGCLPHLRSQWIASAYRRRNDDSERVSFPVPTKAEIATADCIRLAIAILYLISIYYRNHEERLRRDVVIPCKHWHPCRPVPRLLRAKALASSGFFLYCIEKNRESKLRTK